VSASMSAPAAWSTLALQTGGAVIDGNTAGADLTVTNLAVRAVAGIGSADALDTQVRNLAFSNTTGAARFSNSGGVGVGSVDGLTTSSTAGALFLSATSPIDFLVNTSAASVTVTALESPLAN